MIDPTTFSEFSKQAALPASLARGAEALGGKVLQVARTAGRDVYHSVNPAKLPGALREGLGTMMNTAAKKQKTIASRISKSPGYVADFQHGRGAMHGLRRAGILSNTPKYVGPSKVRKGLNMAERALPGELGVTVPLMAQGAYGAFNQKVDPVTGQKAGLGERLGRAGLGMTTGIVGMRSGKLMPAMLSSMAGDFVGKHVGRAADRAGSFGKKTIFGGPR